MAALWAKQTLSHLSETLPSDPAFPTCTAAPVCCAGGAGLQCPGVCPGEAGCGEGPGRRELPQSRSRRWETFLLCSLKLYLQSVRAVWAVGWAGDHGQVQGWADNGAAVRPAALREGGLTGLAGPPCTWGAAPPPPQPAAGPGLRCLTEAQILSARGKL